MNLLSATRNISGFSCCLFYTGDREPAVANGDKDGSVEENEDDEDSLVFYDRAKSFFDNISCEATDRAKGSVPPMSLSLSRNLCVAYFEQVPPNCAVCISLSLREFGVIRKSSRTNGSR